MFQDNLTRDTITRRLHPVISTFEEEVTPQLVELLPNNQYTTDYAWMYSFEKKLKYRIQGLLRRKLVPRQERILFGAGGVVSEAISNAFVHGHKKDRYMPIRVWATVSKKGLGFSIVDKGTGFDIAEVQQTYSNGRQFFNIAGNGFSLFHQSSDFTVCYQMYGKELCILYPLR